MRVLNSFLLGVGNSPIKKLSRGGGWSGLKLTDTLSSLIAFDIWLLGVSHEPHPYYLDWGNPPESFY